MREKSARSHTSHSKRLSQIEAPSAPRCSAEGASGSSSPAISARIPSAWNTFQRTDQGIAYFAGGVTFGTVGTQELYVFDLATLTIYGYTAYDVRR